jgi:hypothetical protein
VSIQRTLVLPCSTQTNNVFNHANLFIVPGSLDVSGFTDAAGNPTPSFIPAQRGVFTSGNPERRNVQLAVKFIF